MLVQQKVRAPRTRPHSSCAEGIPTAAQKHLQQQACLSCAALGRSRQTGQFARSISCLREQTLTPDRRGRQVGRAAPTPIQLREEQQTEKGSCGLTEQNMVLVWFTARGGVRPL